MASSPRQFEHFYRIGEAARMTGVSPETVRVWERCGLVCSVRNGAGYRLYSSDEIARLAKIRDMRKEGINLAGIRSFLPREGASGPTPEEVAAQPLKLGRMFRQLRVSGGLSLAALSERSGLSPSFLSLIERDAAQPSLRSVMALCTALGVDAGEVMRQVSAPPGGEYVPKPQRQELLSSDKGIRIYRAAGPPTAEFEARIFVMEPGRGSREAYTHAGVEFIYVLSGTLDMTLDKVASRSLKPGDTMYFESTRPHEWTVTGDEPAEVLWIEMRLESSGPQRGPRTKQRGAAARRNSHSRGARSL